MESEATSGTDDIGPVGSARDTKSGCARDDKSRRQAATFRAKAKNMQRDPRMSIHVSSPDFRLWVVAEGIAELGEPVRTHGNEIGQRPIAYIRMRYPDLTDAELEAHLQQFPIIDRMLITITVDRIYGGNGSSALGISDS